MEPICVKSCRVACFFSAVQKCQNSYTRFFNGYWSFEPQPQDDKQTQVIWGSLGTWPGLWAKPVKTNEAVIPVNMIPHDLKECAANKKYEWPKHNFKLRVLSAKSNMLTAGGRRRVSQHPKHQLCKMFYEVRFLCFLLLWYLQLSVIQTNCHLHPRQTNVDDFTVARFPAAMFPRLRVRRRLQQHLRLRQEPRQQCQHAVLRVCGQRGKSACVSADTRVRCVWQRRLSFVFCFLSR